MPIESFKVYEGTLTIGAADLAVSAQILSAAVVPSEKVKETEPEPVLSGDEIPGGSSASVTARFKGKVVQDAHAAGLVAYSYTHAGEVVEFTYTPNTGESPTLTGFVRMVPFQIGGDVSKTDRAKADFDWAAFETVDETGIPVPTFLP
jgi:hypothetical protein